MPAVFGDDGAVAVVEALGEAQVGVVVDGLAEFLTGEAFFGGVDDSEAREEFEVVMLESGPVE